MSPATVSEVLSPELLQEQKKIYDKMDFRKVFADKKETIRHFIESEDAAKHYIFQGRFYCMAHYEIAKLLKTKMKGFDDIDIIKTLYHTLRLGNLYKIDEIKIELDSIDISNIKTSCDCSGLGWLSRSTSAPSSIISGPFAFCSVFDLA